MTQYIAAQTTAVAASAASDIVVTSPVGVSCYGMHGSEIVGKLYTVNSDATLTPTTSRIDPSRAPIQVVLSGEQKDFTITKPGTYRFEKFVTVGTAGIDTEAS